HRKINGLDSLEEHAFPIVRFKLDPAILEPLRIVPAEGSDWQAVFSIRQQNPRLDENLKPVADPQNQFFVLLEVPHRIAEVMPDLGRDDPPGGDVIAIAKAPREAEDL